MKIGSVGREEEYEAGQIGGIGGDGRDSGRGIYILNCTVLCGTVLHHTALN